jgi:hypothetical protein
MGLITLFNGLDIIQTADYIKVSCSTYIDKIMNKHLGAWLSDHDIPNRPTPLPSTKTFLKSFLNAIGDPDPKVQGDLEKSMKISYRSAIGELIYAMTTLSPRHCIRHSTGLTIQYTPSCHSVSWCSPYFKVPICNKR